MLDGVTLDAGIEAAVQILHDGFQRAVKTLIHFLAGFKPFRLGFGQLFPLLPFFLRLALRFQFISGKKDPFQGGDVRMIRLSFLDGIKDGP